MGLGDTVVNGRRMVSRTYAVTVLIFFALLTGVAVVAALVEDGAVGLAWGLIAGSGAMLLVVLVLGLAWPRSTAPLVPDADGRVEVAAPAVLVGAVLGSWLLAIAAAATWVYLAVTDFSRVSEAGPLAVFVLGAAGSLPTLFRLLTGRLHRWRLTLDQGGITYQGWRHEVAEPWSAVRGVTLSYGRNAGVVVDLKASRPDVVLPFPAFLVDPQVLAAEITARMRSGR